MKLLDQHFSNRQEMIPKLLGCRRKALAKSMMISYLIALFPVDEIYFMLGR